MTRDGHIVTFYSFKGGTGRTMTLANVAWILAANGKQVLAVDWDLESPGLHHYFRPFMTDKMLRSSRGVIDMVRDFATAAMQERPDAAGPDWYRRYADVEREAVSLTWNFPKPGGLDLLPAGQQDSSYSDTVSTFDWAAFYGRLNGVAFLDALRESLRNTYDYVLIDSRTGLSDSAGICTVNLPDTVINCFTLNDQSINGAAAVAESILMQRGDEPIRMLPVPMRIEDAELLKLEAGRDLARYRFEGLLRMPPERADAYWGEVEIPYKPFFAYEEILAVFGERSRQENSLLSSFERLAALISNGEITALPPLEERDRRRWLAVFERQKPARGFDVIASYAAVDRAWADWISDELTELGQRVTLREVDLTAETTAPDAVTDVRAHLDAGGRVVAVLSQDYVRSPQAAQFWRAAQERDVDGRGLIPIRVDSGRIGPPFAERPVVDVVGLPEGRTRDALFAAFDWPFPPRGGAAATDPAPASRRPGRRSGVSRRATRPSPAAPASSKAYGRACRRASPRWSRKRCTVSAASVRPRSLSSTPTGSPPTTTWSGGSPPSSPAWSAPPWPSSATSWACHPARPPRNGSRPCWRLCGAVSRTVAGC